MPVPNPRNKILPARGNYADLIANVDQLVDGEICYAIDQDLVYMKEGSQLVATGATKEQGTLADSALQPGDNVSGLVNDAGYITAAEVPAGGVTSVNTKTGAVVLDASDVGALAPGDSNSSLTNDAGYITLAEVPPGGVTSVNTKTGAVVLATSDLTNDSGYITSADVPPAYDDSAITARLDTVEGVADSAIQPGTVNPVYFADQAAFPDATANHGAVAHSHADGAMFFAHGGAWSRMANSSEIPSVNNLDIAALPVLP